MGFDDILNDPLLAEEIRRVFQRKGQPHPIDELEMMAHRAISRGEPGMGLAPARAPAPTGQASQSSAATAPQPRGARPPAFSVDMSMLSKLMWQYRSIVEFGRPMLRILNHRFELPESGEWRQLLEDARARIERFIPSVGRIDMENHPSLDWAGTGWLVDHNILVTNNHVAKFFAYPEGDTFSFFNHPVNNRRIRAFVDFSKEDARTAEGAKVEVTKVIYMAPGDDGPDIAFLELEPLPAGAPVPEPIAWASDEEVTSGVRVATIGHPAIDSRTGDLPVIEGALRGPPGTKRLSPGRIKAVHGETVLHDCSTLGGSSGSLVMSIESGSVLGLHFGGRPQESNYAVSARVIKDILGGIGR
ncbi:trypsin-like serine peptidase [Sorangium sp. So ce124]|uniref:trypsin-like serine peptidase n=1 Tax=Sorangium sp. So ce124 TaxID=3133280 RepID=UPI003F622461